VERSDSTTLGTLDHFSHFTLNVFGEPLSGATQSLALWARILYNRGAAYRSISTILLTMSAYVSLLRIRWAVPLMTRTSAGRGREL